MENRRIDDLITYMSLLIELRSEGYQCFEEIDECTNEIRAEIIGSGSDSGTKESKDVPKFIFDIFAESVRESDSEFDGLERKGDRLVLTTSEGNGLVEHVLVYVRSK